jgi:wyosine [tRNA(Phe)-imidazoG37] synthetase (radical SAM superfamily)
LNKNMNNQSQSQASSPKAISLFIDRLMEEKKFENISAEVLEQIKEDLTGRVEDRINAATLENMPKEKLEEFNELLDTANSEEIQQFCHKNIPNLDEVIAKELLNFRTIYLNS